MSNPIDLTKKVKELAEKLAKADADLKWEMAASAVDIAGMVDPTPASDAIGAAMALRKGDYAGAGMSVLSMVPYLGDALAKPAKAVRAAKKIGEIQKSIGKLTAELAALKKAQREAEIAEAAAKKANAGAKASEAGAKSAPSGSSAKAGAKEQADAAKPKKDTDCKDCKGNGPKAPLKKMPLKRVKPCFSAKNLDPSKQKEFAAQLKRQEEALNRLTVDDFMSARKAFKKSGRGSGSAQRAARKEYSNELIENTTAELRGQGMSKAAAKAEAERRTKEVMKSLAALHEPDMIAGGSNVVSVLGDSSVNSSIGSQWKTRIDQLDEAAGKISEAERKSTLMNAKLPKCP